MREQSGLCESSLREMWVSSASLTGATDKKKEGSQTQASASDREEAECESTQADCWVRLCWFVASAATRYPGQGNAWCTAS